MNPEVIFNQVYDILVEHVGASPSKDQRESFVHYFIESRSAVEWRFCGNLGFGGKLYRLYQHYYVSYYPEDRTAERDAALVKANELLKAIPYWCPPPKYD